MLIQILGRWYRGWQRSRSTWRWSRSRWRRWWWPWCPWRVQGQDRCPGKEPLAAFCYLHKITSQICKKYICNMWNPNYGLHPQPTTTTIIILSYFLGWVIVIIRRLWCSLGKVGREIRNLAEEELIIKRAFLLPEWGFEKDEENFWNIGRARMLLCVFLQNNFLSESSGW